MEMSTLEQAQQQGIAPWEDLTVDLGSVKVFRDRYPVTIGHRLFVPAVNDLGTITECFRQAYIYGEVLVQHGHCDAFNVGMNCGASAGQTVMYPHVHCIPRRQGDCVDPVGGVRGVIAHQKNYRSEQYRDPHGRSSATSALDE